MLHRVRRYLVNVLISLDQLVNTLFGGDPDETISSRWGKSKDTRLIAKVGCDVLDAIQPDHCERAIEPDEGKRPG